jgi:hypothetical protein
MERLCSRPTGARGGAVGKFGKKVLRASRAVGELNVERL